MTNQETNLEEFLDSNPCMRKRVHECVSCHHRGHKPELPVSQFDPTGDSSTKLRRLVDEMALDEAGVVKNVAAQQGKPGIRLILRKY